MNYGKRFRAKRIESGYSQKEAAHELGISPYQLCNYEKGRTEPSLNTLIKMSELYHQSVDSLLGTGLINTSTSITSPTFEELVEMISKLDETKQEQACDIAKTIIEKI